MPGAAAAASGSPTCGYDGERRYVPLGHDAAVARAAHAQLLADRAAGRLLAAGEGEALVAVGERWLTALGRAGRKPRTLDAYRHLASAVYRAMRSMAATDLGVNRVATP